MRQYTGKKIIRGDFLDFNELSQDIARLNFTDDFFLLFKEMDNFQENCLALKLLFLEHRSILREVIEGNQNAIQTELNSILAKSINEKFIHHKILRKDGAFLELIEFMARIGVDMQAQDEFGFTPLHLAIENKHDDISKFLINLGVELNTPNKFGYSPLHLAVQSDGSEVVDLLIQGGANVNQIVGYGFTPLHLACERGNIDIVFCLLEKGGDINAKNDAGRTPLDIALRRDQIVVANRLEHLGATKSSTEERFEDGGCFIEKKQKQWSDNCQLKSQKYQGEDLGR